MNPENSKEGLSNADL